MPSGMLVPLIGAGSLWFISITAWGIQENHRSSAMATTASQLKYCDEGTFSSLNYSPENITAAPASYSAQLQSGHDAYRRGNYTAAVSFWQRAQHQAEQTDDVDKLFDTLLYLSDAYHALSQPLNRLRSLSKARSLKQSVTDPQRLIHLSSRLAQVHVQQGNINQASKLLDAAISQAQSRQLNNTLASLWNDYGLLYLAMNDHEEAENAFKVSKELALQTQQWQLASRAGINQLRIQLSMKKNVDTETLTRQLNQILNTANRVTDDYAAVEHYLSLADLLRRIQQEKQGSMQWRHIAYNLLCDSIERTRKLKDLRLLSYALGNMGLLYADEGRFADARRYTKRAMFSAQLASANESLYRWEWQLARLLRAEKKTELAIAAYRDAIRALQKVRPVLMNASRHTYLERLRPIYLELADLVLRHTASLSDQNVIQEYLLDIRRDLEQVKVAEIEDYFKHECVLPEEQTLQLEKVATASAILYPVLLPDRVELIVSLPNGMKQISTPIDHKTLSETINNFRQSLELKIDPDKKRQLEKVDEIDAKHFKLGQQLYHWIIEPLEDDLRQQKIKTIVLVPDGPLRSIPLSALYDGEKYLVQRFAIATTLGLNLTSPQSIEHQNARVLLNGLTLAVDKNDALPAVETELNNISDLYPSKTLKDEKFKRTTVEKEMAEGSYSIVHIASHGVFNPNINDSYILTYDDKLTMERIENTVGLRRYQDQPLELLVLSACETAAGDERSALGLAGVALKAGARSALATLWRVSDAATAELVSKFYRHMKENPSMSKAVALQKAQSEMIDQEKYKHPYLWAPFLMLGNWL